MKTRSYRAYISIGLVGMIVILSFSSATPIKPKINENAKNNYGQEFNRFSQIDKLKNREFQKLWRTDFSPVNNPLTENSTVCGYITDALTDEPICNASVMALYDNHGHYDWNHTYSNESGFYNMKVAAGTIDLYVDAEVYFLWGTSVIIQENETYWINVSLNPTSPQNSTVCGYITDVPTGKPIRNAMVYSSWHDDHGHYDWSFIFSNDSGFYHMNVFAGYIDINVDAKGYFYNGTNYFPINENETLWINVSLDPIPPQNSTVCGYITDTSTDEPIVNATVGSYWYNDQNHYDSNETYSNNSGFYQMNVCTGHIEIYVNEEGYFYEGTNYFDINENETLWINVSLTPYPPENSIICGYITDALTGEPIKHAHIDIVWTDNQDHYRWNHTHSDNAGFYYMNVATGNINYMFVYAEGYSSWYDDNIFIHENETWWTNISLRYIPPPETAVLKGYVIDDVTKGVIKNAFVTITWKDDKGHYYTNITSTSLSGDYRINVAAGSARLSIDAPGYRNEETLWTDIGAGQQVWLNVSLKPKIEVTITKPENGLYINNKIIFPRLTKIINKFFPLRTVIIGSIDIEADVAGAEAGVNRVSFYIDGTLKATDTSAPYTFPWNQTATYFKHTIKVVAYDNAGPCDIKCMQVSKFF